MNNQKIYEKSNKIETVALNSFNSKDYYALLSTNEDAFNRQQKAQKLIDYLCSKFKINSVQVIVRNSIQPHSVRETGKLRSKTLGSYNNGFRVITMYNLTAKKRKPVAIKTFVNTLLHEFMHHYDYEKLGFYTSLHTAGFYKRITDLKNKLEK